MGCGALPALPQPLQDGHHRLALAPACAELVCLLITRTLTVTASDESRPSRPQSKEANPKLQVGVEGLRGLCCGFSSLPCPWGPDPLATLKGSSPS